MCWNRPRSCALGCSKGMSDASSLLMMLAQWPSWMLGVIAGVLFSDGPRIAPRFVDENGNRFALRCPQLTIQSGDPGGPSWRVSSDAPAPVGDRALVPSPAWSLPEVVVGGAEVDSVFLLEDELRSQERLSGVALCTRPASAAIECGY